MAKQRKFDPTELETQKKLIRLDLRYLGTFSVIELKRKKNKS
jgi:hypothetical protein